MGIVEEIKARGFLITEDEGWLKFGVGKWIIQAPDGRVAVRQTEELQAVLEDRDAWVRIEDKRGIHA